MNKDKLRELLKESLTKTTKAELANALRIPTSSIHNYLYTDTEPTIKTLQAICNYYDIDMGYFFSDEKRTAGLAPCTAHPVCQELCAICEELSDYWKHELLEYAQFIKTKDIKNKSNDNLSGGVISDTDRGKQKQ